MKHISILQLQLKDIIAKGPSSSAANEMFYLQTNRKNAPEMPCNCKA